MSPLNFIKLPNAQAVHAIYSEDHPAIKSNPFYNPCDPESPDEFDEFDPVFDFDPKVDDMVERMACNKTLVLRVGDKIITTNSWFITYVNNELIYDHETNDWVNLNMFDEKNSVCTEIYYVK